MKNVKRVRKKKSFLLICVFVLLFLFTIQTSTKYNNVYAETRECSDVSTFGDLMRNANDGDVIKITNDMSLGQESKFRMRVS